MITRRAPPRPPWFRSVSRHLLSAALITCGLWSCPGPARAIHPGQWTSLPLDPGFIEVHMVLLPGDNSPYHSRILMWDETSNGEEFGWKAGFDGCGSSAWSSFESPWVWNPGERIFCDAHTMLEGGEMFSAGGVDIVSPRGIRDARTFQAGSGTAPGIWTARPLMSRERFYPTATPLGTGGRVLVSGGTRSPQLWSFSGRRNGSPPTSGTGDEVQRLPLATLANWDRPVTPQLATGVIQPPEPREGHTAVQFNNVTGTGSRHQVIFGGKGGDGNPVTNTVWLLKRNVTETTVAGTLAADYTYEWSKLPTQVGLVPSPRSDHIALGNNNNSEMVIYGGIDGTGAVLDHFRRLYKDVLEGWKWVDLPTAGSPGPRYGHAAVYHGTTRKLYLFGGSAASGADPTEAGVKVFTFNDATFSGGSWSALEVTGTPPAPRRDHTLVLDPVGPALLIYGGYLAAGASDPALYRLDLSQSPALPAVWSMVPASAAPAPRAGHAAYFDKAAASRRLFIFGGEPTSGAPLDDRVYFIQPDATSPAWSAGPPEGARLSGQTLLGDPFSLSSGPYARISEVYDATTTTPTWTEQTNSGWLPPDQTEGLYPVQFLVSGASGGAARVVRVGPDPIARYLDLPSSGQAAGWVDVPNGDAGFMPLTGVMYEPDKLLIAGGMVEDPLKPGKFLAAPTARSLDMAGGAGWQVQPDMEARFNHNLVPLPTGQVLAVGGVSTFSFGIAPGVQCPQIWTPGNPGSWTNCVSGAPDKLADEPVVRNYHSVAILLPNATVLTGGGNQTGTDTELRLFCPPYLFNGLGNPALRPVIDSAPANLTWGQVFTVCTSNPGAISKVCMIRPAASTHSFDQNGRHVRLTFSVAPDGPPRLFVTAPMGPDHAPPGDYLLFILGSSDGPEVPSIAKWVRLQGPTGSDLCDVTPGATLTDLAPEIVGSNSVSFTWTATADDGELAASGPAQEFDLRYSYIGPINNQASWDIAHWAQGEPPPGADNTPHNHTVQNLQSCTTYYFALRSRDDNTNLSGLHGSVSVQTTCGGGGGGEFSARPVSGGEEGVGTAAATAGGPAAASASGLQPPTGTLVTETGRRADGSWRVSLRLATEADGLDPGASTITVERESASGERDTVGRYFPGESEGYLGLCSLRERGRVAIPGFFALEQVMPRLHHRGQDYGLADARHSRLGTLGTAFLATGGSPELLAGDVLDLTYAPASDRRSDATSWYLLVRRQGTAPPIPFSQRRSVEASLPARFALHLNEPNPAGNSTMIRFDLPAEDVVRLEVFDLLGRHVVTLAEGHYPPGRHVRTWDLRDAGGGRVRPGIYACRLVAGEFRAQRKMGVLP